MLALTQCWFTRTHVPVQAGRPDSEGVFRSTCRYCERQIISWDRKVWHIADGFNLLSITGGIQKAFLFLVDTRDDCVVARFPIDHLDDESEISAFAKQIKEDRQVDAPGSFLVLRDSRKSGL